MKLSLNSLGCPDWTPDRFIEKARALGCEGVEIRGLGGKMLAAEMPELASDETDFIKKLKEYSIFPAGFGASSSFHDAAKVDGAIKEAKESVDAAYRAGIGFVRVFGNNVPKNEPEEVIRKRVADAIREVCLYSEEQAKALGKAPVKVLLETHGDFNTVERITYVIKETDSEVFGILWDVAHTDKVYGNGYLTFYNAVKPYIRHIHLKNHIRSESFRVCTLAEGDIPVKEIVKTLIAGGFDGYFSYEYEKKWHPELPDPDGEFDYFVKFMRDIEKEL